MAHPRKYSNIHIDDADKAGPSVSRRQSRHQGPPHRIGESITVDQPSFESFEA